MRSGGDVVIGDVHARSAALHALLRAVGVLDAHDRRDPSWRVVQLGDLLDRHAAPEDNLVTAQLAARTIDVVLAGNHEARMLADPGSPHGHALTTLAVCGWPHAAAAIGGWLVTHAGVHPVAAGGLPHDAHDCAAVLNHRWHRVGLGRDDAIFHAVGPARGGEAPFGGLLWLHAEEWPDAAAPWPQITGHVPQPEPRLVGGARWAIDLGGRGGRIAAVVRPAGQRDWQPVVARQRRGAVARIAVAA